MTVLDGPVHCSVNIGWVHAMLNFIFEMQSFPKEGRNTKGKKDEFSVKKGSVFSLSRD